MQAFGEFKNILEDSEYRFMCVVCDNAPNGCVSGQIFDEKASKEVFFCFMGYCCCKDVV